MFCFRFLPEGIQAETAVRVYIQHDPRIHVACPNPAPCSVRKHGVHHLCPIIIASHTNKTQYDISIHVHVITDRLACVDHNETTRMLSVHYDVKHKFTLLSTIIQRSPQLNSLVY